MTCKIEHNINQNRLRTRGWTNKEINKALTLLHLGEKQKSKVIKTLDLTIYWVLLLFAIISNFFISVTLVPILLILSGGYLAFTILLIGLIFGYLFSTLIKEIDHFVHKKAIIAELLIPAIGFINIFLITRITNTLAPLMNIPDGIHNPLVVAFLYALSFSTPRIFHKLNTKSPNKI